MSEPTTPSMPVATDQQEQAAQHRAAEKAAEICITVLEGASTHTVAHLISLALMQFYATGGIDALDRLSKRKR